jgi:hypothetical protein
MADRAPAASARSQKPHNQMDEVDRTKEREFYR